MAQASSALGLRWAAAFQALLALLVLCVLAFAPPAHGRTLLIPVDGEPISRSLLDRQMLTRLATGPLPGSVVVDGKGRALAATLFNEGIIMLAAPAALCTETSSDEGETWTS